MRMHRNLQTYSRHQRLRSGTSHGGELGPSRSLVPAEGKLKRSSNSLNSKQSDLRGELPIPGNPVSKKARASPSPTNPRDEDLSVHWQIPDTPSAYQTPYPTALNESQKFRIESSRGVALPSNHQFSPVPGLIQRRTSSRNLKENANKPVDTKRGRKAKTGSKSLASPFSSRPGSAASSPAKPLIEAPEIIAQSKPTRALSDTHFNANLLAPNVLAPVALLDLASLSRANSNTIKSRIKPKQAPKPKPQAQSTTASPTDTVSPRALAARRPSAPTSTRPTTESWLPAHSFNDNLRPSSVDLDLDLENSLAKPDFNRPPSQLTYFPEFEDSGYFDFNSSEVLGISTPFGGYRTGKTVLDSDGSSGSDEGHDKVSSPHFAPDSPIRRPRLRSPWLSDSLISPPTVYNEEEPAYMKGPTMMVDTGTVANETVDAPVSAQVNPEQGGILDELFEGLGLSIGANPIAPPVTPPSAKKGKLDSLPTAAPASPCEPLVKGRARRSTLKPSDFPPPRVLPVTRTRSGSIIRQPPLETTLSKRSRSGTIRGSELIPIPSLAGGTRRTRSGTIVGASTSTNGAKRARSGTITAAPSLTSAPVSPPTILDSPGESGATGSGSGPLEEGLEEVDEILLKSPWKEPDCNLEEWRVAERTSPLAIKPRRGKPRPRFHKRTDFNAAVDKKSLGQDDEIMLKPGSNSFE